jgi:hypothetical protein
MKVQMSAVKAVVEACLGSDTREPARTAIKYLSPELTIRASRQFKAKKKEKRTTIVLSIGEPNYAETEFIKKCMAAGEPFPVRKIQLRWYKK